MENWNENPQDQNEEVVKRAREQIAAQIDFEKTEPGLDSEDYGRALNRAVSYRGLDPENAEVFLNNAIETIEEVKVNFSNSISDQVQRAQMIVDDIAGIDGNDYFDAPPIEEVVRFINVQFADPETANQMTDEAAMKIGKVFSALKNHHSGIKDVE